MEKITYDGSNIVDVIKFFGADGAESLISGSNEKFNLRPMGFIVRRGESFAKVNGEVVFDDNVNHPSHYGGDTTYETIKVIEAWDLGFHLSNTLKYLSRAGKKGDELEDLRKAQWYLERKIQQLEKRLNP